MAKGRTSEYAKIPLQIDQMQKLKLKLLKTEILMNY